MKDGFFSFFTLPLSPGGAVSGEVIAAPVPGNKDRDANGPILALHAQRFSGGNLGENRRRDDPRRDAVRPLEGRDEGDRGGG